MDRDFDISKKYRIPETIGNKDGAFSVTRISCWRNCKGTVGLPKTGTSATVSEAMENGASARALAAYFPLIAGESESP